MGHGDYTIGVSKQPETDSVLQVPPVTKVNYFFEGMAFKMFVSSLKFSEFILSVKYFVRFSFLSLKEPLTWDKSWDVLGEATRECSSQFCEDRKTALTGFGALVFQEFVEGFHYGWNLRGQDR